MSFSDEVNAARRAKAIHDEKQRELAASQKAVADELKANFCAEVKELWESAEQYWQVNAEQIPASLAEWILSGRSTGSPDQMVAFPRLPINVTNRPRLRVEWEENVMTPEKRTQGFNVGGWFAICAPGEVRELQNLYKLESGQSGLRLALVERSYFRVPENETSHQLERIHAPAFIMGFEGPEDKPNIALHYEPEKGIELYTRSADTWEPAGTLRQHLASAVAEALDKPSESDN